MSFWNSKKVKKTRKIHKCEFCFRTIQTGKSCNYESGIYEGEFQSYYMCDRCIEFISKHDIDLSDGFCGGEFWDCVQNTNLLDCPKCRSPHHDYLKCSEDGLKYKLECNSCGEEYEVDLSFGEIN